MTHLHVHSNHSLLEGTAEPRALVARAVEYGLKALALTDTGGLYGGIPFYRAAREAGVKPIRGAAFDGTLLLARDRGGYAQLCRLVTAYHLDPDFDLADQIFDDSIFVLASDLGLIAELRARGVHPLVAVTHYGGARSRYSAARAREFALAHGLRPVAVTPVYFIERDHHRIHRVLAAIRHNATIDTLPPNGIAPAEAWFRSPHDLERLYEDWPETLENIAWVVEHCNLELEFGRPLFPETELPYGETPFSYLWKLAFDGVKDRYRPLRPEVTKRLQYELDIINQLGFAPYFLVVNDIVRYAREHGIPIVGRGSAANSLVSYALGITRAEPFKYDLYFERFLNLSRTDCPDIDLDICWRRRDDVIDYVYRRYGADRVAMICTLNTFQARSAVREVAKAFGMTESEAGEITRQLPHYRAADIRAVVQFLPECRNLRIDEEPLRSIVSISEFIDGSPRHLSIHSGGVVIAPQPLTDFVPLQRATKGILITQYDMGPVEELGLVKMDLLGHRSLTVIDETLQKVWDNRGIRLDIEHLPDPDALTASLIRAGRTIGCFQIESPAMRALLRHTLASNTDMLIKTLSLVRPGPSGSGMKKHFIDRHLGKEKTEYLHPSLEAVLGDTYGVMLYQEDILKVASVIAGMDLAEADALRRAMTKKRYPAEMAKSMRTFIGKAVANGVPEATAEEIWALIANFAKYSYCKAHASTYGEIAYQCTYLKAHFPAEFLSSVLSNRGGYYYPAVYLEEAKRFGIEILPPDVNLSLFTYTVEGDAIRVGFVEVRNLAQSAVEAIFAARRETPIRNLADLLRRTGIGRADAEILIHSGACDSFGQTRTALLWELSLIMGQGNKQSPAFARETPDGEWGSGTLFPVEGARVLTPRLPDLSRRKRTDQIWNALGLIPSTHPLEYYLPALVDRALVLSSDMPLYTGRSVTMIGWLVAERRVGLKDRGAMKFLTFEDPAGVFEGVLFPDAYQACGHLLTSHGPYFVTGEIQEEDHYCTLIVDGMERTG
ncbi:MAG: DNA polymerase III subunit alpha [Candidatus Hydrogenedentes bacterium]|nr:DNA polymerase III subunit alpha [Candidatus Hydrogenedentota bacterium]